MVISLPTLTSVSNSVVVVVVVVEVVLPEVFVSLSVFESEPIWLVLILTSSSWSTLTPVVSQESQIIGETPVLFPSASEVTSKTSGSYH